MRQLDRSAQCAIRCRLVMLVACALSPACSTMSPVAPANPAVAGNWRLDAAASDSVSTKVADAVSAWQAKLRRHNGAAEGAAAEGGRGGYRGGAGGSRGPGDAGGSADGTTGEQGPDAAGQDFDMFRQIAPDFAGVGRALTQVLTPPATLQFEVGNDYVRIAGDGLPPRTYHADEQLSRIDEYGTAQITVGWSGSAFELRARYSSHALLVEHFEVDAKGALNVVYHLTDPMVGRIDVTNVYRRG